MKRRRAVTDKMQLLETAKLPSRAKANGGAEAAGSGNGVVLENGAVNRGFTSTSTSRNFYAVCSPPNSAQSNGHVIVAVDT